MDSASVVTVTSPSKRRVFLLFATLAVFMAACTKKPSPTSTADHPESASDSNSTTAAAPVPTETQPVPSAIVQPPPPPPPPPPPIVIPSGTVLTVRLQQAVGSKTSQQGDRFDATMAQAVVVKGEPVIPAGTTGSGTVTEAHAAGRFKGGATLGLSLDHLVIHGTSYRIQTMVMSQTSKGKGKRTGVMVGGGAGAGALIGGIAGGGKGAAIGALVGAGAGTAGAGLTGNRDIALGAESSASFQMTQSLTLKQRMPASVNAADTSPENPQQVPPQHQ